MSGHDAFADARTRLATLQLTRLERLTDVVYAIVLWQTFDLLPRPGEAEWTWRDIPTYLYDNAPVIALTLVGVAVTIIYWLQNNALNGKIRQTDVRHTVISICQIFLLLLFLYALRVGVVLDGSPATRVCESMAAAMMGVAASIGFSHAIRKRRLLHPDVSDNEAMALSNRILAEPITAIITVPFAFLGAVWWELAWLTYPLVVMAVRRKRTVLPG